MDGYRREVHAVRSLAHIVVQYIPAPTGRAYMAPGVS